MLAQDIPNQLWPDARVLAALCTVLQLELAIVAQAGCVPKLCAAVLACLQTLSALFVGVGQGCGHERRRSSRPFVLRYSNTYEVI